MPRINPCVAGLSLGVLLALSGKAYARAQDVPGQVCQKETSSGGTRKVLISGLYNGSTSQVLKVDCPIVLFAGVGRSLFIGGTDQNASQDFSCSAKAWDNNLATVAMPAITISTGTYTNATVGAFSIPDNVAKLVVYCEIPPSGAANSGISDFYIQD
jgi:hypothetical protein